jgi:segregation and condensation protein B
MTEELKYIIEALLFVSETPLPADKIKKILETPDAKQIKQALDELLADYESRKGAFTLREVAGGFQLRTRPEYAGWIKKLVQPGAQRLSKPALETLAVIAYKQPVIRADIEFIRGVDCGGILRMLLEKKLIRVLGRKEIPGRPMVYATTRQFLELFDLKDLKDLPSPSEIQALGNIHALDENPDGPMEIKDPEEHENPGQPDEHKEDSSEIDKTE